MSVHGLTNCPNCFRSVAVVGTQIQKHRTRLGAGDVIVCAMSGKPVDAVARLKLSTRAMKKKPRPN
jgi:translation initiation factor IF-1